MSALRDYEGDPGIAGNDSKGCGGVMRVAPIGLFWWSFKERVELTTVFEDGKRCAELTHGHRLPHHEAIKQMGEGWVAEEALAISVYCALVAESFEQGVVLAVNHDGDSDSTGAITGNLLGAMEGTSVIPERWLEPLELRAVIETVASDLWTCRTWHANMDDAELRERYPGY